MPNTMLLTPEDIALELDTDAISVHRLIARRQLQATLIPPDKWRILPDVFSRYVRAGADDYRDLRQNEDVLTDRVDEMKATELEKAVVSAAEKQRLSDSQLEVRARQALPKTSNSSNRPLTTWEEQKQRNPAGVPTRVDLRLLLALAPAITEVLDGPIKSVFKTPVQTWVYSNFGDLYLGQKLREALLLQERDRPVKPPRKLDASRDTRPMAWLYSHGPEH